MSGVDDLEELRARLESEGLRVVERAELDALVRELTWLRGHSARQTERIEWLRTELANARSTPLSRSRDRLRNAVAGIRRKARPAYSKLYSRVVLSVGARLPQPLKNVIKKVWSPWPARIEVPAVAPAVDERESTTYDVICFSIIDWSFRWQRPQQLMSKLADLGHRIFFFKTSAFLEPGPRTFEAAPLRDNVWEITLAPPVPFDVYRGEIPAATVAWFPRMLDDLRREFGVAAAVSILQIPTWTRAAEEARARLGWKIVYDCMDEWKNFPGIRDEMIREEKRLVAAADVVTVSAARLFEKWKSAHPVLVRNAADFDFYASAPREDLLGDVRRPVVGYFGAIASWFDVRLVRLAATERPDYTFVLIGGVFNANVAELERLPNVRLLGQQPYAHMPSYLASFDACMIPFVDDEITAATDPVKFYEYVSLGKPVVATPMPELAPYGELLYIASTPAEFMARLDEAVGENDPALAARRVALARENTWTVRAETLRGAIRDVHAKVSIIVVTYFNRELTRLCLDAVLRTTLHPNVEVIVVDNASTDGTPEMLEEYARRHGNLRVILNRTNIGFAAANNQGIRAATGDVFVLLNNDTVPARGWLPRMLRHLQDPQIGIVVAVTNFSGNESRIAVPYTTLDGMPAFAEEYARANEGKAFDIRVAAMYCVGLSRDAYDAIGPLDEDFTVGMFEDDDYSHRARLAGLRVVCAEDVFVHHFGQASFGKLPKEEYDAIWRRNQAHYERKWHVTWTPHVGR
ncbi:MAG TPA: glycosyltransferase [Thermoanaerobaculia bacterium]|nr:glycosyltransferase [Thermoanaerobaculia bacterium]